MELQFVQLPFGQKEPVVHLALMRTDGDICICPSQDTSNDLCDSLASVARCLCTSYVDPGGITALVAG